MLVTGMPFTLADLDRITVRMGTGTRTLRQLSDTQFTAWLRSNGARGEIGVVKVSPGELVIPIEERVRVLNDLEHDGFYIEGVMGEQTARPGPSPARLERALACLQRAGDQLQELDTLVGEVGEIDSRVNMRASVGGALQLVELMRGAVQHAMREQREG
jgi:hypothetical protein